MTLSPPKTLAEEGDYWIVPDKLFDGGRLVEDTALHIRDGRVAERTTTPDLPGDRVWRLSGTVSPGFFDIQVNGGGGVLFNADPTADGARAIAAAHRRFGTAAILPTLITDAPEVLDAAVEAMPEAIGRRGVMGLHIEGPHIAEAKRGTHAAEFIRPLDDKTLQAVERLRVADVPVLITLAPEAVVTGQVAALTRLGAVVSIGHSNATAEAAEALLSEGAQAFTHLFNAMSQMQGRAPAVAGAAINSEAYVSIICDGIHVDPAMLAMAIRARPMPDRMILISDAMPTVGGTDHFTLYGQMIRLRDGRLINAEGSLAGAHTTMAEGVVFLTGRLGLPLEQALRMAITNPARLMGLEDRFRLDGGYAGDLVRIEAGAVERLAL